MRPIVQEVFRFGIVGTFGLFVDMAALAIALHLLGLGHYAGRLASYLVAATFTWVCNRYFTFRGKGAGSAVMQWLKFLAVNAAGGIVNFGAYVLVVRTLSPTSSELAPFVGVAVGSLCGLCINFIASRKLVFR